MKSVINEQVIEQINEDDSDGQTHQMDDFNNNPYEDQQLSLSDKNNLFDHCKSEVTNMQNFEETKQ